MPRGRPGSVRFLTIKYAVPHLRRAGGGSVVVTASVNGTRIFSNSGATAYSASKAGQVALTKMLAVELAKHRIRVNAVCPGAIDTAIDDNTQKRDVEPATEPVEYPEGEIPLTDGRPGTSDEVADPMLFLASDASRHITGTAVWYRRRAVAAPGLSARERRRARAAPDSAGRGGTGTNPSRRAAVRSSAA